MLRNRILLNLIPFIAILIGVVTFAVLLFSRMANSVDSTVTDNYHSDAAVQSMSLALSRMDTALQRARTEDRAAAREMFEANARIFQTSLNTESTNRTQQAHAALFDQIRQHFQSIEAASALMFDPSTLRGELRSTYDRQIVPATVAINLALERIRETLRRDLFATGEIIQNYTRTITSLLILGLGVALMISANASFKLSKAILDPIQTLTRAAREIGEGRLDFSVPVLSRDELGELATTFNKMAAQLNEYRRGINQQIVRLHRTMETAITSFSDPVFILDTRGCVELSNPAARELSAQFSPGGQLPPRLAEIADDVIQCAQDFVPDGFDHVLSLRLNGVERSFLPRIHLMRDSDSKPVGVAVVLHDVTRFRLLDDAKTNLVGTVSHELKTPLTSVRMVLHLLLEQSLGPLNQRQNELVQTAHRDSERLLRILDALLDIARLESGASSISREPVHPKSLVQGIVREVAGNAASANVVIHSEVEPGLPMVAVDRQQIGHVFHNFIANAIKHSPPGGVVRVSAVTDESRSGVRFTVCDEGPGISEEYQGRVFDRFFRVPGQAKSGVGLGLSIAREIVVAHGGRVGVRSRPGGGSEFHFVLDGVGTHL